MIAFHGMVNVLITGQAEYDAGKLDKDKLADGMILYSWLYFAIAATLFVLTFFGVNYTIILMWSVE